MQDKAIRVSVISLIVNIILSILKFIAGILGKSSAVVSDAVHSASDVFSTIVVIIGIKLSSKKADESHPYGHEKMESIASIILAFSLLMVGLGIGMDAIKNIYTNSYSNPGKIALIATIISIIVKGWMYFFTIKVAKELNSDSLKADAWHHLSDSLSSIGALVGIVLCNLGFPVMDAVASLLICLLILKVAVDIFIEGCNKIVDTRCSHDVEADISNCILSVKGVERIDDLKTRNFGNMIYVDVEIGVNETVSFKTAHAIAEDVHKTIEKSFKNCKHCMVHANPVKL